MLNPEDINVRAATFGRMVEDFKSSPIGAYLVEKAERQSLAATEELKKVNAANSDDVRELQLKARVADSIIYWLEEAILKGYSALEQLKEEEYGS